MFNISILEYLGKLENGILVMISIVYDGVYYEGTFFYNDSDILLTFPDDLESIVGDITTHKEYVPILKDLLNRVVPYNEMFDRLDNVDFTKWVEGYIDLEEGDAEYLD
jgi:hypothetical protein